jgi:histone H3/H4
MVWRVAVDQCAASDVEVDAAAMQTLTEALGTMLSEIIVAAYANAEQNGRTSIDESDIAAVRKLIKVDGKKRKSAAAAKSPARKKKARR